MNQTNTPIVDYQNPVNVPHSSFSIMRVIYLLMIALVLIFLFASYMHQLGSATPRVQRIKCTSNLRQIGQAIQLYISNQNALPDSAEKLILCCNLSPNCFVCPSTNDVETDSTNPTLKGHCSYIFLFENKPLDFIQGDANRVLAYENVKHHENDGANILFADGHVDWFDKQTFQTILADLNKGYNPPRKFINNTPTTTPAIPQNPK